MTKNWIKIFTFLPLLVLFCFLAKPVFAAAYQAARLEQSHPAIIELTPSSSVDFWVKFKNIGDKYWSGSGDQAVILRTISGMKSKFTHPTWFNEYTLNRVNPASSIYVNDEALFRFSLSAPNQAGLYWEKFNLYAGSNLIPGGEIEIPIKVLETAAKVETPAPAPQPAPAQPTTPTAPAQPEQLFWQAIPSEIKIIEKPIWQNLSDGPNIEVGLLYVEKDEKPDYLPFRISTLNNLSYDIYDQDNQLLVRNTNGETIGIDYDYQINRYFINDSDGKRLLMTSSLLTLKNSKEETIFKIHSWKNGPFWDGGANDNEFRGSLEINFNSATGRLWLINQLPMEKYLKGVAEVPDTSNFEFLKAQAVAARTYTAFRFLNPKYTNTPDGDNLFTVKATQADQVYRGYQWELRSANIGLAAEATKGLVATYRDQPISAYYFAQSDGRTRSSYEAKMTLAPVDYLISKTDPPGQGKTLKGHGVGMPQNSGITAANQGANFSQILKYYYTGIDLTKIY